MRRLALAVLLIAVAFGVGFLIGTAPWSKSATTRASGARPAATITTITAPSVPGLKTGPASSTTTITRPATTTTGTTTTSTTPPTTFQNDCDHNGYAGCSQHPCGFHNPCSWVRPPTVDAALRRETAAQARV